MYRPDPGEVATLTSLSLPQADPALDTSRIVATATLQGGQQMEITAMVDSPANLAALYGAHGEHQHQEAADEAADAVSSSTPTPALSSALSSAVSSAASAILNAEQPPASPATGAAPTKSADKDKIITGSTIIFFDDEPASKTM